MYTTDTLSIYEHFLKAYHVQLTLLGETPVTLSNMDLGLRGALFPGYQYESMCDNILAWIEGGEVCSFRDDFGMQYLAFLCDKGDQHAEYRAGIVGPFLYERPTSVYLDKLAAKLALSEQSQNILKHILLRVAYISDRERWISTNYYMIGLLINGAGIDGVTQVRADIAIYINNYSKKIQQENLPQSTSGLSASDSVTEALLTAIKNADIALAGPLILNYADFMTGYHRNADLDPYDVAVGLNTMLLQTALKAGVDAVDLSDVYLRFARQIAAARKSGLTRIPYIGMAADYCSLIAKYRPTHKNPIITQAVDYLNIHYRENIRLRQLAEEIKVSEVYLSALFHQETGVTVIAFLQDIRIRQAKELLENTSLPIQRIAEPVGFSDANYFSKMFRQSQGCSPTQYRKKLSLV